MTPLVSLLNLILAIVFIYLVLSLLASELQEVLASLLEYRAKNLRDSIKILLNEDNLKPYEESVTSLLYNNSQITTLNQSTDTWTKTINPWRIIRFFKKLESDSVGPSYISDKVFANALIDVIQEKLPESEKLNYNENLEKVIEKVKKANLNPSALKRLLQITSKVKLEKSNPTLEDFKNEIASWYNRAQERTSGVYRRHAKGVSLIIGLIIAIFGNVDTLHIVNTLSNKDSENLLQKIADETSSIYTNKADQCVKDANQKSDSEKTEALQGCLEQFNQEIKSSLDFTTASNILGWNVSSVKISSESNLFSDFLKLIPTFFKQIQVEGGLIVKFLGWLISAFAISMGAPFWFDLLGRVINVRNSGKIPVSAEKTSSTVQQN